MGKNKFYFFSIYPCHYLRGTFCDCVGPVFIKASLFSFTCYFWTGFLALKVLVEGGTSIFFLLTGNFEGLDDALWGSSWGTEGGWGLRVGWGPGGDWGGEAGLGLPGFEAVLGLFLGAALALEDCTGLDVTPGASAGNLGQDSTCNSSNYLGNYDKTNNILPPVLWLNQRCCCCHHHSQSQTHPHQTQNRGKICSSIITLVILLDWAMPSSVQKICSSIIPLVII